MPEFNVQAALDAGYSEDEIARFLAQQSNFDVDSAVSAGYSPTDIISELQTEEPAKPKLSRKQEWDYVWDATPTMTERAATWLQSRMPLPGIEVGLDGVRLTDPVPGGFDSEEQRTAFYNASSDARLEFLKQRRQQQVLQENPEAAQLLQQGEEIDNGWAAFTREMMDPASLIAPAGTGLRGMAMSGALFGASYDIVRQNYEQQSEFTPGTTLLSAAAGGVLSPLAGKLAKEAPELVRVLRGKPTRRSIQKAEDTLVDFEEEFTRLMAREADETTDPAIIAQRARENLELPDEDYYTALTRTDREAALPTSPAAARQALEVHEELANGVLGMYKPMGMTDQFLGNISTRVRMIDEGVFGRLRDTEFAIHKGTHDRVVRASPFIDDLRKLPRSEQNTIARHLANGDFDAAEGIIKGSFGDTGVKNFETVRGLLDEVYDDLADAGVPINKIDNYYPRQMKDLKGFYNSIGREAQEDYQKQLALYAKRKGFTDKTLPNWEKANFTNMYLRGRVVDPAGRVMGHAKARTVSKVTEGTQPFYHDPTDALTLYLIQATKTAEKYRFFGKNKTLKNGVLDVEDSVGALVADRNLSQDAISDLRELLSSRWIAGEVSPHETLQKIRNIGYLSTLANPFSAAIQVADLGLAKFATRGDILPAMFKSLTGRTDVNLDDLGLGNLLVEELNSAATSVGNYAKVLNWGMKWGGFQKMDRFGKNTIIQAALKADQKAAQRGGKSLQQFRKKWQGVYGDEAESLIADLKDGVVSDNVKLHLWNRLSDVQPISLSEMPKKYLDAPNGRLFYSLKSFGLKQLDLLRREVGHRYAAGDKRGAAKAATAYMAYVIPTGLAVNEIRELMQGREVLPEDIPDQAIDQLLRLAFMSQYSLEKIGTGGLVDSVSNIVAPPMNVFEDGARDAYTIIRSWAEGDDIENIRSPRNIPVIGKAIYNLLLGGNERANEFRERRRE